MKARLGATEAEVKIGLERIKATESDAAAVHQEIPNEQTAVETIGALEGRSGDQRPAGGYRNPLKRRTKDSDARGTPKGRTPMKRRWVQPKASNGSEDETVDTCEL
jgi:hypothetical protein